MNTLRILGFGYLGNKQRIHIKGEKLYGRQIHYKKVKIGDRTPIEPYLDVIDIGEKHLIQDSKGNKLGEFTTSPRAIRIMNKADAIVFNKSIAGVFKDVHGGKVDRYLNLINKSVSIVQRQAKSAIRQLLK